MNPKKRKRKGLVRSLRNLYKNYTRLKKGNVESNFSYSIDLRYPFLNVVFFLLHMCAFRKNFKAPEPKLAIKFWVQNRKEADPAFEL